MNQKNTEKLYTLSEACELLSISTATGRNWMKSGRLVSVASLGTAPVFEEAALLSLKEALATGSLTGLKSRRNKVYINGTQTYGSYLSKESKNHAAMSQLSDALAKQQLVPDNSLLYCLLRHCAEQLCKEAGSKNPFLFEDLLNNLISADEFEHFQKTYPGLCDISYSYVPLEDTLGFLYLSLCSLRDRKSSGSYYTPAALAKKLVEQHITGLNASAKILDPSCGTGIFLLQLPENIPLQNIYGTDLNPVSVMLTRINLAIKHQISTQEELDVLNNNITVSNFLNLETEVTFDIILGNPPWGAKLSVPEKKYYQQHFSCARSSSMETSDLFLEQSMKQVSPGGLISFVLPEAILTVKSHTPVRELLLKHTAVHSVEYLGEVFEKVHCPSIILTVVKDSTKPFFKNVPVTLPDGTINSTHVDRIYQADFFSFSLSDPEYQLLQKLFNRPNCTTLVDKSDFALGIVTGDNATRLHSAPAPGLEPVIKGSDISKYHIHSASAYLRFQPDQFQQTAPEHFYRAPEKLFYRFINRQLIFAYDATGLLSLNSCNILIPRIDGLSVKYIMAILNSGVAQFIFEKKFRSVKVLRSHLEQIPIPIAEETVQKEITGYTEILMKAEESSLEYKNTFSLLDKRIAELYGLSAEEYQLICS